MSGNLLVRFDEGRVGRTHVSPSLLLYSLGALEFGSLSSNHALSTSTSGGLDSRNCQTL